MHIDGSEHYLGHFHNSQCSSFIIFPLHALQVISFPYFPFGSEIVFLSLQSFTVLLAILVGFFLHQHSSEAEGSCIDDLSDLPVYFSADPISNMSQIKARGNKV